MNNYFRITGYIPAENISFIVDNNGMYETLSEFSLMLVEKNIKVYEVSVNDNFIDINTERIKEDNKHIYLIASANGKPEYIKHELNGIKYKAIKVADKIYIPNNQNTI